MSRQDQFNVTVGVSYGGVTRDLGTFDKMEGFEVTSESTKFFPGGLGQQLSLGGRASVEDGTVSRLFDLARDQPIEGWLINGVGKAEVVITKQSLTIDGLASGKPLVYRGKLQTYTPVEPDSESTDAALFELEVSSASVTQ